MRYIYTPQLCLSSCGTQRLSGAWYCSSGCHNHNESGKISELDEETIVSVAHSYSRWTGADTSTSHVGLSYLPVFEKFLCGGTAHRDLSEWLCVFWCITAASRPLQLLRASLKVLQRFSNVNMSKNKHGKPIKPSALTNSTVYRYSI